MLYLDTHVAVWLYSGETGRLSRTAKAALAHEALRLSPLVLLEMEYLYECGKVATPADSMFEALKASSPLLLCGHSFESVVAQARGIKWTRDAFDRLITAQAMVNSDGLLTADERIRAHYPQAIW